jgi:hypothetical protein
MIFNDPVNTRMLGSVADVSKITSIPVSTLNFMRRKKPDQSPPFFKIGGKVFYPLTGEGGLESWIQGKIEAAQREINHA